MRKLVTVAKIEDIKPIEGADSICAYRVRNWWVVDKKNKYSIEDLVLYYEIDSFIPIKEEFEFLRKSSYKKLPDGTEGFRLKTIKLRGQISQGLITKIPNNGGSVTEGDDWTDILNVTKYELPIPVALSGEVKGNFPNFMPKTDEERIQNIKTSDFNNWKNLKCYYTEKIDGTSITIYFNNNTFGVCSRNLELKYNETNSYWEAVNNLNLERKLRELGKNIALQGELFGNGVQGNKYKQNGRSIAFFNVFDIDKQSKLPYKEFVNLCKQLELSTVPVIDDNFVIGDKTVEDLLNLAEGFSVLNTSTLREGIVVRDYENNISFKVISNSWLTKYE